MQTLISVSVTESLVITSLFSVLIVQGINNDNVHKKEITFHNFIYFNFSIMPNTAGKPHHLNDE